MNPSDLFLPGYALPFLIFAGSGAHVTRRFGWYGLSTLLISCAIVGGAATAIAGGLERKQSGTGGFDALGLLISALAIGLLLLPSSVTVGFLKNGSTSRRLTLACIAVTLVVGILAYFPFALTIGCSLSGECL